MSINNIATAIILTPLTLGFSVSNWIYNKNLLWPNFIDFNLFKLSFASLYPANTIFKKLYLK